MILPVAPPFTRHVAAALARLRYLFPKVSFTPTLEGIDISGDIDDPGTLTREVSYALYREKIYAETLPMRRALIDTVTRR